MKKWKQITSWLLVFSIVLVSLVGCGSGNESSGGGGSQAKEENDSQVQAENQANNGGDETERPTFTVATVRYHDLWSTDFYEEGVFKELEDKHNINIEWQIYTDAEWAEKKSTMFISGDMPDAFFGNNGFSAMDYLANPEYFVNLTDLIPQYMPNLSKILEEDKAFLYAITETDGNIWSLGSGTDPKAEKNVVKSVHIPFINKVWLDNLGLDMPETYEDLANVLKAFASQDANGNGDPTDEIAYISGLSLSYSISWLAQPFGLMPGLGGYFSLDENKDIVFVPTHEKYKEAVKWMHDLWDAGCFNPEAYTADAAMTYSLCQGDGGCRVGLVWGWDIVTEVGQYADEFVAMPPVTGPDGNKYTTANPYDYGSDCQMAITTKCKDPAKLLEWADDFYTDDVNVQTIYGSFGVGCEKREDGTYFVYKDPDATFAWCVSPRAFCPRYQTKTCLDNIVLEEGNSDEKRLIYDELHKPYIRDYNCAPPALKFTEEQTEALADLATSIPSYCEQQHAHWITEGGIEEEWDAYIEQLNKMGLQEYIDIMEEAYNTYLEMTGK